jgi:hypothetical protein
LTIIRHKIKLIVKRILIFRVVITQFHQIFRLYPIFYHRLDRILDWKSTINVFKLSGSRKYPLVHSVQKTHFRHSYVVLRENTRTRAENGYFVTSRSAEGGLEHERWGPGVWGREPQRKKEEKKAGIRILTLIVLFDHQESTKQILQAQIYAIFWWLPPIRGLKF